MNGVGHPAPTRSPSGGNRPPRTILVVGLIVLAALLFVVMRACSM
jgi:hypothetical protein